MAVPELLLFRGQRFENFRADDVFDPDQTRARLVRIVNDALQDILRLRRTIMFGNDLPAHIATVKVNTAHMSVNIAYRWETAALGAFGFRRRLCEARRRDEQR